MATQWLQFFANDSAVSNTGKNYGPFNINPVHKLLAVEVRGAVVFANASVGSTTQFSDYIVWGFQFGAAGYTPPAINAASNNPDVLVSELHVPQEIPIVVTPSTAVAAVIVGGPVDLTWRGQLFVNANTDLYFQTAHLITPPTGWSIYASIRVWFT